MFKRESTFGIIIAYIWNFGNYCPMVKHYLREFVFLK